ncbi:MAG TPA: c-type cytochrome [Pyrinomonadaceae bacterium]|nr:c-type cytochrome [Pyrinomonadaceae bacterium]
MNRKIKIFAISIFALFAVAFLAPKGNTQTQTVTAGQKFKNIKVLTDMPADQMGKVMNQISASLGVNCAFCHVVDQWEKDDKKSKDEAREMMRMTFELNKAHFNNRPEITCNTCHNGHDHPAGAPNLYPAAPTERPKQPETKPVADDILAKYVTAIGGKANLDKITSRQIKASRVEPDGTTETEELWQKGNKLLATTTYNSKEHGTVVVTEGFDGTTSWKKGANGNIELKQDEAEQIKRNAQLWTGDLKSIYKQIDYRFFDKIDGREVYILTAQTADNQRDQLFFDVQTGFLVRRVARVNTILGAYVYQYDFADYKDFGGVKIPTTMKFAVPNIRWTRKILEVKNNAAVDDAKFSGK